MATTSWSGPLLPVMGWWFGGAGSGQPLPLRADEPGNEAVGDDAVGGQATGECAEAPTMPALTVVTWVHSPPLCAETADVAPALNASTICSAFRPSAAQRRPTAPIAPNTAGTTTAPAYTGPPSKVSSKSAPCAAVPLTKRCPRRSGCARARWRCRDRLRSPQAHYAYLPRCARRCRGLSHRSDLVKGEVAYTRAYPLFRDGAFSLSSTARSQCS